MAINASFIHPLSKSLCIVYFMQALGTTVVNSANTDHPFTKLSLERTRTHNQEVTILPCQGYKRGRTGCCGGTEDVNLPLPRKCRGWKDLLEELLLEAEIGKTLGQIGQELGVDGNQSRL